MGRTLFERLRPAPSGRGVLPGADGAEAELCASIGESLRNLLSSHLDMADASPDYGLPDIGEVARNLPGSSAPVVQSITACIRKYEPRLVPKSVEVTMLPQTQRDLTLCFRIRARLADERSDREVWFDTEVAASGRVRVEPR